MDALSSLPLPLAPQTDESADDRNSGPDHPHEHLQLGVLGVELGLEAGDEVGSCHVADSL